MDTTWLTYDELAAALNIAPDSARRLVARRKWPRRPGNDGRVRIEVPLERLTPDTPHDIPGDKPPDVSPDTPPIVTPDITLTVRVLTEHIETLRKEIEAVKAERDLERVRAAQVDALQAALEIERQRVTEWQAVADRWAQQAERLAVGAERRRGWWLFGRR